MQAAMVPRWLLVLLGFASLATFYTVGSSAAALACIEASAAMPAGMPMNSDCPDAGKSALHGIGCTPTCVAVAPTLPSIASPPSATTAIPAVPLARLATRDVEPEPPPPRLG